MKDPYEVLGLDITATEDEIKAAYRLLVRRYHPDQYAGNPLAFLAQEKLKEIKATEKELKKKLKKLDVQNMEQEQRKEINTLIASLD